MAETYAVSGHYLLLGEITYHSAYWYHTVRHRMINTIHSSQQYVTRRRSNLAIPQQAYSSNSSPTATVAFLKNSVMVSVCKDTLRWTQTCAKDGIL
jgi:hypothetical protein